MGGKYSLLDTAKETLGDSMITIVDIGARNKTWELPNLAPLCHVIGFEPNKDEYSKIIANTTDYEKFFNKELSYHSVRYINKAVSDKNGVAVLRITEGPGAVSLLEPNTEFINRIEYYTQRNKKFAPQFRVVRTERVETVTLDHLVQEEIINQIDYLKLDTQGNELDCIKGASTLLKEKKIGVIKTEVEFDELYKEQKLFADVDIYLRANGFILLDISFNDDHKVIWSREKIFGSKGTLLFADAYYALSIDEYRYKPDKDIIKHSLVLAELGFLDYSINLLRTYKANKNIEYLIIEQQKTAYKKNILRERIRYFLMSLGLTPHSKIWQLLTQILQMIDKTF